MKKILVLLLVVLAYGCENVDPSQVGDLRDDQALRLQAIGHAMESQPDSLYVVTYKDRHVYYAMVDNEPVVVRSYDLDVDGIVFGNWVFGVITGVFAIALAAILAAFLTVSID